MAPRVAYHLAADRGLRRQRAADREGPELRSSRRRRSRPARSASSSRRRSTSPSRSTASTSCAASASCWRSTASGRTSASAKAAICSSPRRAARRRCSATTRCRAEIGADILHLDRAGSRARFPYVATDDIAAGAWGRSGEGWFDGYALMQALAPQGAGARRRDARPARWRRSNTTADGRPACGSPTARSIAGGRGGAGGGHRHAARLSRRSACALPVEARKRCVFTFACREPLPGFPLLIDPSGVYVRPEGDLYLCGMAPPADGRPAGDRLRGRPCLLRGDALADARRARAGLRGDQAGARLGRALRLQHLRPERHRRAASPASPICWSRPASPATACSRRRRSAAGSPS